jgi:hypothetical protein
MPVEDNSPLRSAPSRSPSSGASFSGSSSSGTARNTASIFRLLSRIVLIVTGASIFAALFPIQPWQPLWYLKAGQIAIDYSVTILFSLLLLLLAYQFRSRRESSEEPLSSIKRFCSVLVATYLILIPVQLFSFGLHGLQTSQREKHILRDAQSQVSNVRRRIHAAASVAQVREALGAQPLPAAPQANPSQLLSEQKTRVIQALEADVVRLGIKLRTERQQRLAALAVNTAKGVLGSAVIAFGVARIRRLQSS